MKKSLNCLVIDPGVWLYKDGKGAVWGGIRGCKDG